MRFRFLSSFLWQRSTFMSSTEIDIVQGVMTQKYIILMEEIWRDLILLYKMTRQKFYICMNYVYKWSKKLAHFVMGYIYSILTSLLRYIYYQRFSLSAINRSLYINNKFSPATFALISDLKKKCWFCRICILIMVFLKTHLASIIIWFFR